REKGHVSRAWLGIAVQPITAELSRALRLHSAEGALVSEVEPGSPADRAGIRAGDVIVRMNDQKIARLRDLTWSVSQAPAGRGAELELIRSAKHETTLATLQESRESRSRTAKKPVSTAAR